MIARPADQTRSRLARASRCSSFSAGCKEQPKPQPPPPPKVTVAQPVRQAVTDNSGSHREHPGHLHGPAGRPGRGVSREGAVPGRATGQEGPAALRHPAEHVRGQPPAGRGADPAAAGPAASTPESQLTRYSNLIQNNAAAQTDVDNWRFQRDTAAANLRAARGPARPGQAQPGLHPVTAPFDGRMDRRLVDPGNLVGSAATPSWPRSTRSTRSTSTSTSAISIWPAC